jgi:putative transposase
MKKNADTFIHQFKLIVNDSQTRVLDIRFGSLRQLYNASLSYLLKQDRKMQADKAYQQALVDYRLAREALKGVKKETPDFNKLEKQRKEQAKQLSKFWDTYELSKTKVEQVAKACKDSCHFKDHIDAVTCQVIADRAFKAYCDYRLKGKGKPRFKSWKNALRSISGKQNVSLRFKDGKVHWTTPRKDKANLELPIRFSRTDKHGVEQHALTSEIKYCRLLRKIKKGRYHYYVQLVLKGKPFVKKAHQKQFAQVAGQTVGLDIGPSTIAAVSGKQAFLKPFVDELKNLDQEIKVLQRKMARSLRLNNPDNYVAHLKRRGNKTIKVWKVKKGVRQWVRSKSWEADLLKLKELHRLMADKRTYLHEKLALEVLFMGQSVLTERLSYRAFQRCFGKSVGFRAPGLFITTLKRKASKAGAEVVELPTHKAKLSQYNHVTDTFIKKPLSQRYEIVGDDIIQRDLYSAFLAMCFDSKNQQVDRSQAVIVWPSVRSTLKGVLSNLEQQTASSDYSIASLGINQVRAVSALKLKAAS